MSFLTSDVILTSDRGTYETAFRRIPPWRRVFPSLFFYRAMMGIVWRASRLARRGVYDTRQWAASSREIIVALEAVGVRLDVGGGEHFAALPGPCVFIGNHMSTLETFVLPALIAPVKPVTFVIKQSLVEYPIFRHVMVSRDPVVVGRANPREDLQTVLEEGRKRLAQGTSIVLFPQTTRTTAFDPAHFNTLGVKLARRAGVPVVPLALCTDAWGNGRHLKEFGAIDPARPVRFAFGPPLAVEGSGQAAHAAVVDFIRGKLREWGVQGAKEEEEKGLA